MAKAAVFWGESGGKNCTSPSRRMGAGTARMALRQSSVREPPSAVAMSIFTCRGEGGGGGLQRLSVLPLH